MAVEPEIPPNTDVVPPASNPDEAVFDEVVPEDYIQVFRWDYDATLF